MRRRPLVLGLAALGIAAAAIAPRAVSQPTAGEETLTPNSTRWSNSAAPERFRHGPVVAVIGFTTPDEVHAVCMGGRDPSEIPPGKVIIACAVPEGPGFGRVLMPDPCLFPETDRYAHILCHELGHLRGWSGLHGD